MLRQLTLDIQSKDELTFDNFYSGQNQEVICALKSFALLTSHSYIYLTGHSGTGKSHLLQACCSTANGLGRRAFYLSLDALNDLVPAVLEDLDHFDLIAIDSVQAIAGIKVWEYALFNVFNQLVQKGGHLLLAGQLPPKQLGLNLIDLESRLASGVVYWLKPFSDSHKMAALQLRAHQKGFNLSQEVAQYLLNHYPRDMTALFKLVDILDHASLSANHRITIPFMKSVL